MDANIRRPELPSIWVLCLAVSFGALAAWIGDADLRWVVYATLTLLGLLVFLIVLNKERLLTTAFFLTLQIDVYLRFLYGTSGSREGLAVALVTMTGIAVVLWAVIDGGMEKLKSFNWVGPMGFPIVAVLGATTIAITTTAETFIAVSQLVLELQLYFLYWLTMNLTRSQADFERIVKLLMITLGVQSIIYLFQSAFKVSFTLVGEVVHQGVVARPGGTVSTNPAGFTSFIMPPLMIAIALFLTMKRPIRVPCVWLLVLTGSASVGLSFTRAPWAALVLGFVVICLLLKRQGLLRTGRAMMIVAVLAAAAAALIPTLMERVSNDYSGGDAWKEREGLMRIAIDIIKAHPVTGIGPGAYSYIFKNFISSSSSQWLSTVHNEFLLRTAENGILGGIAFLLFILSGLRVAWRLAGSAHQPVIQLVAIGWFAALLALAWQMAWVPWRGFSYNGMLWLTLGLMDGAYRLTFAGKLI